MKQYTLPTITKDKIPFIIIFIICCISIYFNINMTVEHEVENKQYAKDIKKHKEAAQVALDEVAELKPIIDKRDVEIKSLKASLVNEKELYINLKKQYNENIEILNTFYVSDMQYYFDERFGTSQK